DRGRAMTFKDTGTPRTDPELIRAIIRANHHGATIVSLAARHGISTGTISHWIARSRNSGWVWPTPDDIVAWKIKNPARVKNRQYRNRSSLGLHRPVDRTGTQRRLQALYAIGHDWQSLAGRLGVTKQAVRDLANRRG